MHTKDKVSVIFPTCDRYNVALENIKNIQKQQYSPLEIIVCDDSNSSYYKANSEAFIDSLKEIKNVKYNYTARFDVDGNKDYGLARARNVGTIEADGEFLIFLDDRITPKNNLMIVKFIDALKKAKEKVWLFGDKGAKKTSFVEMLKSAFLAYFHSFYLGL